MTSREGHEVAETLQRDAAAIADQMFNCLPQRYDLGHLIPRP
jgi:hypothetical protein